MRMALYIAHYRSANAATDRAKGVFEFESESKAGSKANMHDARLAMLETFGSGAVSWIIDEVTIATSSKADKNLADGQLELDFREPVEPPKRKKRSFDRGLV